MAPNNEPAAAVTRVITEDLIAKFRECFNREDAESIYDSVKICAEEGLAGVNTWVIMLCHRAYPDIELSGHAKEVYKEIWKV